MFFSAKTTVCGIIGNPVEHSLSPVMHNAAYNEIGADFVYVAFPVTDTEHAIKGMRALNIRGLSVTIPHKETVIPFLDEVTETSKKIGAINTIVNENGVLKGSNTDWIGCMEAVKENTNLRGKKTAVLGAGGAARAVVFGLKNEGADVTIFNRTLEKARNLAEESEVNAKALDEFDGNFDVVINTTSLGMGGHENKSPITPDVLNKNTVVMDIVYVPKETKLLREAKQKGCKIVYGYKMLLYQGVAQFELFTGKKAPVAVMENTLKKHLEI